MRDGRLVEVSVVVRLFRMRLLAIDASVIVAPAQVEPEPRATVTPAARGAAIGARLAAAERCLGEGAASLRRLDADA